MRYVELDRAFVDYREFSDADGALDPETLVLHARHFGTWLKWSDLLKEGGCVVVLGEARSGKTFEFRHQGQEVAGDEPRFYLPVEGLAQEGLDLLLDAAKKNTFEQWVNGSGRALFFLDAVDEAKLKRVSLDQALRNLRQAAGPAFHRAGIFVSCRVSDWRPSTDLAALKQILTSGEEEGARIPDDDNVHAIERKAPEIKVVFIAPLDQTQIRQLASERGVEDPDSFVDAIAQREAEIFAGRPGDISWLARHWSRHGRLARFYDLMEMNVAEKLRERNYEREPLSELPENLARDGVEQLGAAASLSASALFRIPDEEVEVDDAAGPIDPAEVLPHWSSSSRSELLSRGIFDEATYGRVGFHQRTVREYLAANWFRRLLDAGCRRKQISQILFADLYGQRVARPSLEPVIGWLATMDDEIRQEALEICPAVLISGGDSTVLRDYERAAVLERVADLAAEQPHILREFDWRSLQRFMTPGLAEKLKSLISKHGDNKRLLERLVDMVEAGRMTGAKGLVRQLALSLEEPVFVRTSALEAAMVVCPEVERTRLVTTIANRGASEEIAVLVRLAETAYPESLTPSQLLEVIKRAGREPTSSQQDIDTALSRVVSSTEPRHSAGLLSELVDAANWTPEDHRGPLQGEPLPWLTRTVIALLARTVSTCRPDRPPVVIERTLTALRALRDNNVLAGYQLGALKDSLMARARVRQWLFWRRVGAMRKLKQPEPKNHHQVVHWADPWEISEDDFTWLTTDCKEREDPRDRELSMRSAFWLYARHRDSEQLQRLRHAVSADQDLTKQLRGLIRDLDRPDPEIEELNAEHARKEEERARKAAAQHKRNRRDLRSRIEGIEDGTDLAALCFLWQRLPGSSSWGRVSIDALEPLYGKDVAGAFRAGLGQIWAQWRPTPHREDNGQEKVPPGVYLGLTALALAQQDGLRWRDLSKTQARVAAELALWELNGYPDWLELLAEAHPAVIQSVFAQAIERGLRQCPNDEPRTLARLKHSSHRLRALAAPSLQKALHDDKVQDRRSLRTTLGIVLEGDTATKKKLLALCRKRARHARFAFAPYWAAWWRLDAPSALVAVEEALRKSADPVSLLADLRPVSVEQTYSQSRGRTAVAMDAPVTELARLIRLCYLYLDPSLDISAIDQLRDTDSVRAEAQGFRDGLLNSLASKPGSKSYAALRRLAELKTLSPHKGHLLWLAACRIAEDAESRRWQPREVPAFLEQYERAVATSEELFQLVLDRLFDLKEDIEKGDFSPRALFRSDTTEVAAQVFFARELKHVRRRQYTVQREEEVDRSKRPDIRVSNPMVRGPIGIEVKIADNWTVAELEKALEEQLVGSYLKAIDSRFGVLLLAHIGSTRKGLDGREERRPRYWLPSDVRGRLYFDGLLDRVEARAKTIAAETSGVEGLAIVGIDFL